MDPTAILPPNSSLWKSSKIDISKPSWNPNPRPTSHDNRPSSSSSDYPPFRGPRPPPYVPSRANATPIEIPSNPPRTMPFIPPSSFVHPNTIDARDAVYKGYEPPMSSKEAEDALKNFFESALEPEKDDDTSPEDTEDDEDAGKVDGLHVKLMKHQIEGLEFLRDHECEDDKVKGKGKGIYGGILADDVLSSLQLR